MFDKLANSLSIHFEDMEQPTMGGHTSRSPPEWLPLQAGRPQKSSHEVNICLDTNLYRSLQQ
jgi:hypothetical protein